VLVPATQVVAVVLDVNVDNLAVHKVPILVRARILDFARRIVVNPLWGLDLAVALLVISRCGTVGGGRVARGRGRRDGLCPGRDGARSAHAAGRNDGGDGSAVVDGGISCDGHPFSNDVGLGTGGCNGSKSWDGESRQSCRRKKFHSGRRKRVN
jgi:hypothetical protein